MTKKHPKISDPRIPLKKIVKSALPQSFIDRMNKEVNKTKSVRLKK